MYVSVYYIFFFFNDTATTEIYTLSLHDALPILGRIVGELFGRTRGRSARPHAACRRTRAPARSPARRRARSEEHTSELQSQSNLVCRLLLEKKKEKYQCHIITVRQYLHDHHINE